MSISQSVTLSFHGLHSPHPHKLPFLWFLKSKSDHFYFQRYLATILFGRNFCTESEYSRIAKKGRITNTESNIRHIPTYNYAFETLDWLLSLALTLCDSCPPDVGKTISDEESLFKHQVHGWMDGMIDGWKEQLSMHWKEMSVPKQQLS